MFTVLLTALLAAVALYLMATYRAPSEGGAKQKEGADQSASQP